MARPIPEETIDEIRSRCDIVNVINEYVPLQKKGNEYWACCPFHKEKTPSFKVSPDFQSYYCFGCQASGNVFKFVMDRENVDFVAAVQLLARRSGVIIPEDKSAKKDTNGRNGISKQDIYEVNSNARDWYQKCLQSEAARTARDYLENRGVDENARQRFSIGYSPDSWDGVLEWGKRQGYSEELLVKAGLVIKKDSDGKTRKYDRFRGRLMFPIWDELGRVTGFSARTLDPEAESAKYINTPETQVFKKGKLLYGLHLARQAFREFGGALVCEGQLDVIACHRAGLTHAVAPQGTAFTETQAQILKRFTDSATFCFDSDKAGQNAVRKSLQVAAATDIKARVVMLPPDEDPDSIYNKNGAKELNNRIKQSRDGFEFLFELMAQQYSPQTPDGKEQIVANLLEVVTKMSKPVTRASLCQWLSGKLDIPESAVFDSLNNLMKRQQTRQHYRKQSAAEQSETQNQTPTKQPERSDHRYSQLESAKIHLLDLALHHGPSAHKLAENEHLTPDNLSDSTLDKALMLVLQKTAENEWQHCGVALSAKEQFMTDNRIARILAESHYSHLTKNAEDEKEKQKKEKQLQKALDNCLLTVEKTQIDREIKDLSKYLHQDLEPEENKRILQQYQRLVRKKNQLQS